MAEGEWHPFRGPLDFLIPDDLNEFYQSVAISTATGSVAYLAWNLRVAETMGRMASHHYRNPSLRAIRNQARRQTLRAGIWRGLGLAGSAVPIVGWTALALSVVYSLPPSGRTWSDVMAENPQWAVNPFTGHRNPHHR